MLSVVSMAAVKTLLFCPIRAPCSNRLLSLAQISCKVTPLLRLVLIPPTPIPRHHTLSQRNCNFSCAGPNITTFSIKVHATNLMCQVHTATPTPTPTSVNTSLLRNRFFGIGLAAALPSVLEPINF